MKSKENHMHAEFALMQKWENILTNRPMRPICQWLTASVEG